MVKPANNRPLADFIQRFFDQFCWANSTVDANTVAKKSKSLKIRIFHNEQYYNETGAIEEIYQGRKTSDLKAFINNWKNMAEHRDAVCRKTFNADLNKASEARMDILKESTNKLEEARDQLNQITKAISNNVDIIADMQNQVDKYFVESEKHKVSIHVLTKKKEFLEARNFEPKFEMAQPEYQSLTAVIQNPVRDTLK